MHWPAVLIEVVVVVEGEGGGREQKKDRSETRGEWGLSEGRKRFRGNNREGNKRRTAERRGRGRVPELQPDADPCPSIPSHLASFRAHQFAINISRPANFSPFTSHANRFIYNPVKRRPGSSPHHFTDSSTPPD